MKKTIFIFAALISSKVFAQNTSKTYNFAPDRVVVYTNGATLGQSVKLNLEKGIHTIRFDKLSSFILPAHIHGMASGKIKIIGINSGTYDENTFLTIPAIRKYYDTMQEQQQKITELSAKVSAVQTEISLFENNLKISGNNGLVVAELQKMSELIRTRLAELYVLSNKYAQENTGYSKKIESLNATVLKMKTEYLNKAIYADITVSAEETSETVVGIIFFHSGGAWKPKYNMRYESAEKPLLLDYNCRILNTTGYDWKNTEVILSTAEPLKSADFPDINPWRIPENHIIQRKTKYTPNSSYDLNQIQFSNSGYGVNNPSWNAQQIKQMNQIMVSELAVEIVLPSSATVLSQATGQDFYLQTHSLKSTYTYQSLPRIEKDAYLIAQITDWGDLNLINGEVDVYNNGTFSGQTSLNTIQTSDTLNVSLGLDHKIICQKKLLVEKISDVFLSSKKKEYFEYELVVKNTHKTAITLKLFDQIPVSVDEKIEVQLLNHDNAKINDKDGVLHWDLSLAPGEIRKFKVIWDVKYPGNMKVQVKQYRSLKCPQF